MSVRRVVPLVLPAVVLLACRGASTPVPDAPMIAAPSSMPSASVRATPAAPATRVCMMVQVCGCNLGCAAIAVTKDAVRVGMHAKSESGALEGKELKIVELDDASGAKVLALTDLDHDHACSIADEKRVMGYGCEAKRLGPVPMNACADGCK